MQRLLILGGGTAGTMIANKLRHSLPIADWSVMVVDETNRHHYQPGYLFVPFGRNDPDEITKARDEHFVDGVDFVEQAVELIDAPNNSVTLADGTEVSYDYLVVATGTSPRPAETPGMLGPEWRKSVHEFYTMDGSAALAARMADFEGGRLVVHITEMPIKCPVAPLEFAFLADEHFRKKGIRDKVELIYVTPLSGAFTKPIASNLLGSMLDDREIALESDFYIESVDSDKKAIVSYDEREIPFDLLVTVPLNMGADFIAKSGLGNELNYVPVDKHTFQSADYPNLFAIGDAADLPTSKAGSVAHFSVDVFEENFKQLIAGKKMTHSYDGHANCFIETGDGKGMLIDFNYDTEPLPGKYPVPGIGPFSLLKESELNHFGKLAFRWMYWHLLLPGTPLPLPHDMSLVGKKTELIKEK